MAKNSAAVQTNEPEQVASIVPTSDKPTFNFKKTRAITVPLFKLIEEIPIYIKVTAAMYVGKEVKGTGDKAKMEPAILMHCINLETGEEGQVIVNKVVQENFKEAYPEDSYVGKVFELIKHAKREGKRYNDFSISEGEV